MTTGIQGLLKEGFMWLGIATVTLSTIFFQQEILSLFIANKPTEARHSTQTENELSTRPPNSESQGFERVVKMRNKRNGHFFIDANINHASIPVVVDTGATLVTLKYEDATDAGLRISNSDYKYQTKTANGTAKIARVTLDTISIGDITLRNVEAAVTEPGKLSTSLLGMSFLNKVSNVTMTDGELTLTE